LQGIVNYYRKGISFNWVLASVDPLKLMYSAFFLRIRAASPDAPVLRILEAGRSPDAPVLRILEAGRSPDAEEEERVVICGKCQPKEGCLIDLSLFQVIFDGLNYY
jgi:hypothetical protein